MSSAGGKELIPTKMEMSSASSKTMSSAGCKELMNCFKTIPVWFPKMSVEPYSHEFNCIMRAFQNTLESYPHFLIFTLLGGLSFPAFEAIALLVYPVLASVAVYTVAAYTCAIDSTLEKIQKMSAMCGLLWVVSRVVYTRGYYTGDPEQKKSGAFGQFAMFVLLVLNIVQALQVLGVL